MNDIIEEKSIAKKENLILGIIGAVLFSLIGGAIYSALYFMGVIAFISGILTPIFTNLGYIVFSKKDSKKGVIISAVIAILIIVICWYLCSSYDIYGTLRETFEETCQSYYDVTYADVLENYLDYFDDPEFFLPSLLNLLPTLFFTVVGSSFYIWSAFDKSTKVDDQHETSSGAAKV